MNLNTDKPFILKANVDGKIITFKFIATRCEFNINQDRIPMYNNGDIIYIAGKRTQEITLSGIITEDDITEEILLKAENNIATEPIFGDLLGSRKLKLS